MKVYKLEIMVLDFDDIGAEGIKSMIEDSKYPNRCIHPVVKEMESRELGEWRDDHPLNNTATADEEYRRMFRSSDCPC